MTVRDTGIGIAEADRDADLRVLPAGRPRRADRRGGHGPRPDAVEAHRRAARRAGCGWRARSAWAAPSGSRSPLVTSAASRTTEPAEPRARGHGPGAWRVVVIEDDRPFRSTCCSVYLEGAGYTCRDRAGRRRRTSRRCPAARPPPCCSTSGCRGIDGWEVLAALKDGPGDTRRSRSSSSRSSTSGRRRRARRRRLPREAGRPRALLDACALRSAPRARTLS